MALDCDRKALFSGSVNPNNLAISYINWVFGDGNQLNNSNLSIEYIYESAGNYLASFNVVDINNCTYSISIPLEILNNELLIDQPIPNVITANGDQINDEFKLDLLIDVCLEYEIIILNRWGNKVFESKQFGETFIGNDLDGSSLSEGVYFYIIRADSQEKVGHLTIIK